MRLIILAFAVVTVVATAAAQPGRVPLTPDEAQFVRNHPPVRMMVDPHFEPADFLDDTGAHAGMAADFLKLLSDRTGLTFVPVPLTPAQRANLDPDARGIDGVALSAATPDRAKFYTFTDTLLEFPAYILTRRSVDHFLTPTDLIGLKVGVVGGYASQEYLTREYPQLALLPYATTDDGLRALSYGDLDAFVSTVPVSTWWLEQEGYSNLKIAGETGFMYRLGVSSRKEKAELGSILQKGVQSISQDERRAIRQKWLNAPYEPFFRSSRFVWSAAAVVLAVLAAVGLAVVWTRVLRRAVRLRTAELAAGEALYRTTLENVSDAVLLARADGTFTYASAGVKAVFGRDPAGLTTAADLFGPDLSAKAAGGLANEELQLTDAGGRVRRVLVTATPVAIADAVWLYVCHDVTDRTRLERQLRQQKTLESIGLLASGVAHDFNNLLQVIGGFTEMAGSEVASEAARKLYLGRVSEATDRATSLTRQLLAIARRKPGEKAPVEVTKTTADLLPLLGGLVGRLVRLQLVPAPGPLTVLADSTQIEQVLLNLLVNARDAMPDGGTATVQWDTVERTAEQLAAFPNVTPGRFVRLRVTDTGTGIPPGVRSKIFDPFFTTKEEGKGTGLGLSVVLGVAQDAGGYVDLQTEMGQGTTFEVFWPAVG
jgi:signal transduction histidine kinase/ABC-type amino acid transport substrate-binding protein